MTEVAGDDGAKPDRELHQSALDKTLADARSRFADMTPEEALESLVNEAVAAARTAPPAKRIDEGGRADAMGQPSR